MNDIQTLRTMSKSKPGSKTSSISLIIPAGANIATINKRLTAELGTSSNIKDKNNRQSVITSLKKLNNYLKDLRELPPNGIALFAGSLDGGCESSI